jgi:TPR repeat protein
MYEKGHVVTQDYSKAIKLYSKATNKGFPQAQLNLGMMYENVLNTQKLQIKVRQKHKKRFLYNIKT